MQQMPPPKTIPQTHQKTKNKKIRRCRIVGLVRHIGNVVYRQRYQGFESLHLRHIKTLKPAFWRVFGFNRRDEGMGQSNKVAHDQSADEQLEKS